MKKVERGLILSVGGLTLLVESVLVCKTQIVTSQSPSHVVNIPEVSERKDPPYYRVIHPTAVLEYIPDLVTWQLTKRTQRYDLILYYTISYEVALFYQASYL